MKKLFLLLFLIPSISFADEAWMCSLFEERLYKVNGNQIDVYMTDGYFSVDIKRQTDFLIFAERIAGGILFSYYFKKVDGSMVRVYRNSTDIEELFKDEYIDLRINNTIRNGNTNICTSSS